MHEKPQLAAMEFQEAQVKKYGGTLKKGLQRLPPEARATE